MAIYIENLNIDRFRGIYSLALDNLNHLNIIAGDNNSGKTSVLEAILLMQNPKDFNNVLRTSRIRESGIPLNTASVYESFTNLFPRNIEPIEISIKSICINQSIFLSLTGEKKTILLVPEDLFQNQNAATRRERIKQYSDGLEAEAFKGEMRYGIGGEQDSIQIEFHPHSKTTGRILEKNNYVKMVYLSPFNHVRGNIVDNIVRVTHDDTYKEICLNILRLFDNKILDILYLKNDDGYPVEYIKHSALGNMPVSTYGDGIKKVLSLANGIAQAANGVLMIDELETAIHSKYYDDIFRFIIKACKQFGVQVFITTHSIEAIDGLLATQDYGKNDSDNISVITFKKESDDKRTYSRILSGRRVYSNREEFGFEVRS
jgi:AAA15 family ATPase/GTPase